MPTRRVEALASPHITYCPAFLTGYPTRAEWITLMGVLCAAPRFILNNFPESYFFRTGDDFCYLFTLLIVQAKAALLRRSFAEMAS